MHSPGAATSHAQEANSAWDAFELTRSVAELGRAIASFGTAVAAVPEGDPGRVPYLYQLLAATHARFKEVGDPVDLDLAIAAGREAVSLARTDTGCLAALGTVLLERFRVSERMADLDEAVEFARIAVALPPTRSSDGYTALASLGAALGARFAFLGSVEDLEESIGLARTALALSRPGSSRKAALHRLAQNLGRLAAATGRGEEWDEAVTFARRAVNARPQDENGRAPYLSALGLVLGERCRAAGTAEGLDEAISCSRAALDLTPADHPTREGHLVQLVGQLAQQTRLTGDAGPMDEAVRLARGAASGAAGLANTGTPGYAWTLVVALDHRYRWAGAVADLDEAVALARAGLARVRDGGPNQADCATALCGLLFLRHRQLGALADLDEAVGRLRVLAAAPSLDRRRRAGTLNTLGLVLWARAQRTRDPKDIEEAITAGREAVATGVHRSDQAMHLSNLANALLARFRHGGRLADLDEGIETTRRAVAAARHRNDDLARYYSNLAHCLTQRFERTGSADDLDEAVAAGRSSVALISEHHPERSRFLANLSAALRERYARTGTAADRSAALAVDIEAVAVQSAPVRQRLGSARSAAADLVAAGDPLRAADLLAEAVRLLPGVSPRRLVRSDQEYALGGLAGLAGEAAALALADPRLPAADRARRALSLLEAGRAVIISQALDGRDDLSELRRARPELAERFVELRDRLDQPWDTGTYSTAADVDADVDADADAGSTADGGGRERHEPSERPEFRERHEVRERHELAAEFAAVQDRIRALDGFGSFGLPPRPEDLVGAAQAGPVAVLNVTAYGSHALLVTPAGVTALPLPELGEPELASRVAAFLAARNSILVGDGSGDEHAGARMLAVLAWLWDVAAGPVLESLGHSNRPTDGASWGRVWWVPCGLLNLLPLHAAGHHATADEEERPRTVVDRVVSSYTPSLRTLVHGRRSASTFQSASASTSAAASAAVPAGPVAAEPRAVVVAMPTTPGLPGLGRLPFVADEVAVLRRQLPGLTVLAGTQTALGGTAEPTKDSVLDRLADHPIAHFCCHGSTDPAQPSRSRLLLQDHERDPLTAASLTPVTLRGAQLAYLSACSTAATRPVQLLDESLHLASAFHVAGFPHVVSTLWEVDDQLSVRVADDFYTDLRTADGALDPGRAAHALHRAVRRVREGGPDGNRNPFFWASYVHIGV
ncbi:CHAT domain-containing protein [Kitasatospora sp. NPDC008050]|uniref:CHAT domain-containing tetratricopeptide repeat protein n=1 Tax=Kitasatospora sp. NPDC008050 TaxID=3364021 RepID=UPI0036EAC108